MTAAPQRIFVRKMMEAPRPRPLGTGRVALLAHRLFGTPLNGLLTILGVAVLVLLVWPTFRFLFVDAVWDGASRVDCLPETVKRPVGACWPFIQARFGQFIYGFYPQPQRWRVDIVFAAGALLLLPLLIPRFPFKIFNAFLFFIAYPAAAYVLLVGGRFGLEYVETRAWGGLLITMVISYTGIIASLPLGMLLALGRRSNMPIVRTLSIAFIEFWRGVPLITVLFFATYMLPLFLPPGWNVDALLRVLIGVTLFSAAYLAEVIRGGLQAIPRGQFEGAAALGLGYWKTMGLIVLPQALKHVIPGLVNSFIALFKDTSLVLTVSIFDLLGQVRSSFADPNWATPSTLFTGFAFAGIIYFAVSFLMSRYALAMERRLNTDVR